MKNLQLQYQGFLNTPNLWLKNHILGMQQFKLLHTTLKVNDLNNHKLRLGKLVERFVGLQLKEDDTVTILAENIQIQNGKRTIGEIDCLLKKEQQPIHLEIIYKFYLYDASVGSTEIEHFIGPNRKDSFLEKLTKLKEKQLPLLYHKQTKPLLKKLGIPAETIQQQVCFKAQLYMPFSVKKAVINVVNPACIQGYYYQINQLEQFANCKFFIPEKKDWLIYKPNPNTWLDYASFITEVKLLLNQEKSPLCWIKKPNNETEKCFVVWW
ncbi:DUF1853 family protein [Oceanihabitans sp. 1_MG-2023]|uniref:DUF1853 family protein n=1 Tax=Flavobacteriaceae TaxID=49546 RepID=UPI002090B8EC|nr:MULTISPECIES: DUF1853 family protein [Flavobacteriaceae]MDO6623452.1 DUF1853 family protein [Oceanihabitans sp. 1_MG-2023]